MNQPTPFGKYYLLERINVGGMAEVFKAKVVGVEGFERIVALKRILPHIAEDEEFITMFIDEAKIAVQLQHANIAQIFDLGKVDDAYFIALEYVQGRDLRGIFDELHRSLLTMPMPQVCYVVMQVCEGLDYAHNKRDAQGRALNLVHRDISPQNVLIGYEGEVKLIDFGIAKAAGKASKTQAGILKGKFGYMSPEQVRGLPIDRRSDIFALGIILYEMLTGQRLFVGESDFSTLEKVRNVEIVPPSSLNSKIPEPLERIVLKALAKDLEDRYQNALDLHDDLQAFLYSVGQFSSRKDLSVWMKKTFSAGLQVDEAPPLPVSEDQVEEIEPVEVDAEAPARGASPRAQDDQALGWDDEELETSIFDKPIGGDTAPMRTEQGFLGPDDKTVAVPFAEAAAAEMNEGFPAATTFSEKAPTHKETPPAPLRQTVMGLGQTAPVRPLPLPTPNRPPAAAKTGPLPGPSSRAPRPGMAPLAPARPTAQTPATLGRPMFAPLTAPTAPGPPRAALRQTLLGVGALNAPLPGGSSPAMPMPPSFFPPPLSGFDQGPSGYPGAGMAGQPYGLAGPRLSGGMDVEAATAAALSLRPPSRIRYYLLFLAFMALGSGGAYLYLTRSGKMQIAVKPSDARVTVDGVALHEGPPFVIERKPGIYHLAVVRDGYLPREQDVEIRTARVERVEVDLEASPETGFELTSQPPGGLVWLDGQPFAVNETGKQATTNFRASRITPGRHVLEIKGDPRFKDWRQEVYQEAGQTLKIQAMREPAVASPSGRGGGSAASGARQSAAPGVSSPGPAAGPSALAENRGRASRGSRRARGAGRTEAASDDGASEEKPAAGGKTRAKPVGDDDIFEREGRLGAGGGEQCVATIGSKPWAEVSIDGKPTGKSTPLMDYSLACGKHRITFSNPDLMIERNEVIILKPGQRFKKIFPLVDTDF